MREFVSRMTADRFAPVWLFLQPLLHVVIMVAVRDFMGRIRLVPGADFIPWLVVGITTYFLFRSTWMQGMNAISANKALFAYRQVHPADTVLMRSAMEGTLQFFTMGVLVIAFAMLGFDIIPSDPLRALEVVLAMTLLGLGLAFVTSVVVTFFPESQKIIMLISFPLYILSGVIFPIQMFPHAIQKYLLYNPLLHGIEIIRQAFFPGYHAVNNVSLGYIYEWVICTLLLGLMLQVRYKVRMVAS